MQAAGWTGIRNPGAGLQELGADSDVSFYVLEQMLRRHQINADPIGRATRLSLAVAGALRRPFELIAWPFQRLAWAVERRLLWPLRERVAGRGPSGRIVGAGALVAVAAVAVAVGALLSAGSSLEAVGRTGPRVGLISGQVKPVEAEAPRGAALHGVPPSFGAGGVSSGAASSSGEPVENAAAGGAGDSGETAAAGEASGDASGESAGDEAGATASSAKPAAAGPEAMKVARRFTEAFVFYEVGERPARAKAVFGETATPQLAGALAERPPRLPANAQVPKARVVNLVPGPRRGKTYTVSASLLRVGLTSELRLEMSKLHGDWLVTDVRG
jgi:hypothetical protein